MTDPWQYVFDVVVTALALSVLFIRPRKGSK
jgi:hypothetical protein